MNDIPGLRYQARTRKTGLVVGVYHAAEAKMDAAPGRWAVVCEEHGTVLGASTLRRAKAHVARAWKWCEGCEMLERKAWADAIKAKQASRTPEQVEQDRVDFAAWMASLPHGEPRAPDETTVVFYRKGRR